MKLDYFTLDVFTETRLAGNPLAVVRDANGLGDAQMQAIAREFNLSETVFLLRPRDPVNTARARIFTPAQELPFAGHPTVGAACLIAQLDAPEMLGRQDMLIVIEEKIGVISCTVRKPKGRAARAHFDLPRLPEKLGEADPVAVAAALGLAVEDIGFDGHRPVLYSAGVGFTFAPVRSLDAIARARPDMAKWNGAIGPQGHAAAFVYTREVRNETSHVHARMFAPGLGVHEDPATGSAAAAFAGVAMEFETPDDGEHTLVIEQGFEMGRPSEIVLGMDVREGRLHAASIGGAAVLIARGEIEI